MTDRIITDEQIEAFMQGCAAITEAFRVKHGYTTATTFEAQPGKRYVRIVSKNPHGSAHAFIDLTNGNVLKPDGWKRPAPQPRGNLNDEHKGLKWMGPHGPAYLR